MCLLELNAICYFTFLISLYLSSVGTLSIDVQGLQNGKGKIWRTFYNARNRKLWKVPRSPTGYVLGLLCLFFFFFIKIFKKNKNFENKNK